jgi:hypothetical protein
MQPELFRLLFQMLVEFYNFIKGNRGSLWSELYILEESKQDDYRFETYYPQKNLK